MLPSRRVEALGLMLGPPRAPKGAYVGARQIDNLLFVSGQTSDRVRGVVGNDVTPEQAKAAAREAALDCLRQAVAAVGSIDRLVGPVKVVGFVHARADFHDLPAIVDGASELLRDVFDEGAHARSAIGVANLPGGSCVEIEMVLEVALGSP